MTNTWSNTSGKILEISPMLLLSEGDTNPVSPHYEEMSVSLYWHFCFSGKALLFLR